MKWTLKALRVNYGLTAEEVSRKISIHHQTLLKYEKNSSKIPMDLLSRLATLYGVSMDDIFLGDKYELKRNIS